MVVFGGSAGTCVGTDKRYGSADGPYGTPQTSYDLAYAASNEFGRALG